MAATATPGFTPQDLTPERFAEEFELPRRPVVITGATDGWAAHEHWRPDVFAQRYGDHKFKVRGGPASWER